MASHTRSSGALRDIRELVALAVWAGACTRAVGHPIESTALGGFQLLIRSLGATEGEHYAQHKTRDHYVDLCEALIYGAPRAAVNPKIRSASCRNACNLARLFGAKRTSILASDKATSTEGVSSFVGGTS